MLLIRAQMLGRFQWIVCSTSPERHVDLLDLQAKSGAEHRAHSLVRLALRNGDAPRGVAIG
jgi:hypothetical protein